jgi:hypothetical protein
MTSPCHNSPAKVPLMRGLTTTAIALALATSAAALAQAPSPSCQALVAQLTSLDRGDSDPARADQIRRADDAVHRQQYQVDRMVSQARQMGCERSGFFSIFSNPPPQCGGLNRQIDQARNTLDRLQMQLEQSQGGNTERAAQRQSLLIALGQNNCGPQYRSASVQGQQGGGFFERLFGAPGNESGAIIGAPQQQAGGTYRTVCVRLCDGYYFPVSYATTPDRFQEDAQVCQRECPAAQVQLYTYHNPGEEMSQAVGLDGQPYTALPTAFQYRKQISPACGCRRPGESWSEALKTLGPDNTVEAGDVVVTDQNAKKLSSPHGADGKPAKTAAQPESTRSALADAPGRVDPTKRKVRTVGPTFLPSN